MLVVALGVGAASAAVACKSTVKNPNHCVNRMGDAWCAEHYGAERPYCILDECVDGAIPERGCVAERPSDACWSRCGETSFAEDPTCEGVATATDSESGMTMGPGSNPSSSTTEDPTMGPGPGTDPTGDPTTDDPTTTTGPVGCDGDDDCVDGGERFCVGDVCVACDATDDGDVACAELDGALPLCVGGTCVACTEDNIGACEGATPICDAQNNSCAQCTYHEQCQALGMPACHIAEGSCITESTPVNSGAVDGIQPAIDAVVAGTPHAIVITNDGAVGHTLTIDGGQIIAIVADPEGPSRFVQGSSASPVLTVNGASSIAYLHRVSLEDGDGWGVTASSGATLYADSAQIVQNSAGQVQLTSNAEGYLRNCFIGGNYEVAAVEINNSSADILYTSILAGLGDSTAVACTNPQTIEVRNSIITTRGDNPALMCAGATIADSAVEDDGMTSWFADYNAGDAHLDAAGQALFADIAVWQPGDPLVDIDGDPRPNEDGAMDYAGADVP